MTSLNPVPQPAAMALSSSSATILARLISVPERCAVQLNPPSVMPAIAPSAPTAQPVLPPGDASILKRACFVSSARVHECPLSPDRKIPPALTAHATDGDAN